MLRPYTQTPHCDYIVDVLEKLRLLQAEVSARNQDLTDEQIDELADKFSRDLINDLVNEGKIRFERDK